MEYKIGINRKAVNRFFLYRIEACFDNQSETFKQALGRDEMVLFCPHRGGSEVTRFISYESRENKVTLQFLGEAFQFQVHPSEVFIQWDDLTGADDLVLNYYSDQHELFVNHAFKKAKDILKELELMHLKHIPHINNETVLENLQKEWNVIHAMMSDLMIKENLKDLSKVEMKKDSPKILDVSATNQSNEVKEIKEESPKTEGANLSQAV
jgi:hypothetical protein